MADFEPMAAGPARRLFVNGKATTIVVGAGYDVDVRCRDTNGRVGGAIMWSALINMTFLVQGTGFLTLKGNKVKLLSVWPESIDGNGRAPGIARDPNEDDEATPSRGYLWDGHRVVALGPAEKVRFGRGGKIEGYCWTDSRGRPIYRSPGHTVGLPNPTPWCVPFTWWDGFRDDGPILKKPPF